MCGTSHQLDKPCLGITPAPLTSVTLNHNGFFWVIPDSQRVSPDWRWSLCPPCLKAEHAKPCACPHRARSLKTMGAIAFNINMARGILCTSTRGHAAGSAKAHPEWKYVQSTSSEEMDMTCLPCGCAALRLILTLLYL